MVTETDELTAVLDELQLEQPKATRGDLLAALAIQAARSEGGRESERRSLLMKASADLQGCWDPEEQVRLRAEWPD